MNAVGACGRIPPEVTPMPLPTPLPTADAETSAETDDLAMRLSDSIDDYASLQAEDAAGLGL